jgi:hypothetical protein
VTPKSVEISPQFHTWLHTFGKGMEGCRPHEHWGFHTFHTFHTSITRPCVPERTRTHASARARAWIYRLEGVEGMEEAAPMRVCGLHTFGKRMEQGVEGGKR